VEPGESPAQAAVRELAEETSLIGTAGEQLWVREDGGRRAFYFRVLDVTGTLRLGGPEAARQSPDNQYGLTWAGANELEDLGLRPAEIAPLLRELL
jgi:8-oxo-dGTP pyrophosphatase MutT (NUDIX family)